MNNQDTRKTSTKWLVLVAASVLGMTRKISTKMLVLVAALVVGIVAVMVMTRAGLNVLSAAPYAVLLLCPLMHLLLHGGHGHHGEHDDHTGGDKES